MCNSGDLCILLRNAFLGINDHNHNVRPLHCGYRTDNTVALQFFFDFIFAAESRCVDKYIGRTVVDNLCIHCISGSSGNIRYNDPVFS